MHLLLLEAEGEDHSQKEIQDSLYSGLNSNTKRKHETYRETYKELKPHVYVERQTCPQKCRGLGEQAGYRSSTVPKPLCFISEDCLE